MEERTRAADSLSAGIDGRTCAAGLPIASTREDPRIAAEGVGVDGEYRVKSTEVGRGRG